MKIGSHYRIGILIISESGATYDDFDDFREKEPHSKYEFGFCVVDTDTGLIPDVCNDWNDSPQEALFDYLTNIVGEDFA